MPSNFKLGYEGKLYYSPTALTDRPLTASGGGTGTHFGNVVWSNYEITNVMDLEGNFESESVDTTTRSEAAVGWSSEINTTKQGQLTFTMRWKPAAADFIVMRAAWLAGGEIAMLDLDGPVGTNGSQGIVANWTLSFNRKMPLKGIMTVDVTAKISSYPNWVTVAGGVLVAS